MPAIPRQWIIGGLTTIGLVTAVAALNDSGDHAFDLRTVSTSRTTSSSTSDVMLERVEPSTTSSSTTSTTSTTAAPVTTPAPVTTAAPVTVAAAPPVPPPPSDPNSYTGCYTWSLTRINEVRRAAGQGAVGATGNTGACRWALALAKAGQLSHSGLPCNGKGGQVVGLYGSSGGSIDPNAPTIIIQGWINNRSGDYAKPLHYEVLTYPPFTRIDLQFLTVTRPDGSWTVYGVGNLCP